MRIIVLGYIVRGPLAGYVFHHMQYVLGLASLGHEVYFLEDSEDYPCCYDPSRSVVDADPSYGLQFAEKVFNRMGMAGRWAYYDAHTQRWCGALAARALEICRTCDLVVNISGVNPLRPWLRDVPRRVLIDTDPVFMQVRMLDDPWMRARVRAHNAFFTFGANYRRPGCTTPVDGLDWKPTRQPVVPELWPVTPGPAHGRFTTVMQWGSYEERAYGGVVYGMKSKSFAPYLDLPHRVPAAKFELALGSGGSAETLSAHGWHIVDPIQTTLDPWIYQGYIQSSKAEWSIAKHGYVSTHSGWFSERSCCYLASGRPVVVEDTGFSAWLPTGAGVLVFNSPDEAMRGIAAVNQRYAFHCRAARALIEEHFAARQVLGALLKEVTG